jgi:hypothetical protein
MSDSEIRELLGIQYGREDVSYATWYSDWSKQLAKLMTLEQIEKELGCLVYESKKAAASHLRAIDATTSMQSQSQRRAQTGNVVRAVGERRMALSGARQIYYLFPEHALSSTPQSTEVRNG